MSSLSGIGSSLSLLSSLQTGSTSSLQNSLSIGSDNGDSDSANNRVSAFGKLLSALQNLKTSDPKKFKDLLTQAASQLQAAAQQAGVNTQHGQFLTDLANRFTQVANGGDLSLLKPTPPTNKVQQAYGPNQGISTQQLLELLGNGSSSNSNSNQSLEQTLLSVLDNAQTSGNKSSTDPRQVVRQVFSQLSAAVSA